MADLTLKILSSNLASPGIKEVAASIAELGAMVKEFAKASVEAFAEQEKADKQLALVAGELTNVFKAQASAFQESLGVSDDMVERIQTLALTFGTAPAQVQGLTQAVLDYSARTGTDAVSATDALIKGVQNGTGNIKALGISFQATGDYTKDMALAIGALSGKFGGSAAAGADTFSGSVAKATEAMGELKEAFGGFIVEILGKSGAIATVTDAIKGLTIALFGDEAEKKGEARNRKLEEMRLNLEDILDSLKLAKSMLADLESHGASPAAISNQQGFVNRLQARYDEARGSFRSELDQNKPLSGVGTGKVKKPGGGGGSTDRFGMGATQDFANSSTAELGLFGETGDEYEKRRAEEEKRMEDEQRGMADAWGRNYAEQERQKAEHDKRMLAAQKKSAEDQKRELEKQQREFAAAGEALGGSLVDSFVSAISELSSGGEFDVGGFFVGLASAVAGIVVGAFTGGAGGAAAASLVGGIGGALNKAGKRKRHDGGWADDSEVPRFHDGGWPDASAGEIPALLLGGERVLSQREVGRMGGPAAVDRAASGGRGVINLAVTTLDAKGTSEFFEDRGGRGFERAVKSGRGDVSRMFAGVR
jgi:hypothetical protein